MNQPRRCAERELQGVVCFTEMTNPLRLYPIQRFILRMVAAEPLDDQVQDIELRDEDGGVSARLTEVGLLRYLNGCQPARCNVTPEQHEARCQRGHRYTDVVLRLGRRSTKTTLLGWLAQWRLQRLLSLTEPHRYYQFLREVSIGVVTVVPTQLSSPAIFRRLVEAVESGPFRYRLRRDVCVDIDTVDGPVTVAVVPPKARYYNSANLYVALEDVDGFDDPKAVYTTLHPTTRNFIDPTTAQRDGLLLAVGCPLRRKKDSLLWQMESAIREGGTSNGLVLHLPSRWCNPLLTAKMLQEWRDRDPEGYRMEYEAEYAD